MLEGFDASQARASFTRRVIVGSLQVAMQTSHADNDGELHPLREVPRWTWAGDHRGQSGPAV